MSLLRKYTAIGLVLTSGSALSKPPQTAPEMNLEKLKELQSVTNPLNGKVRAGIFEFEGQYWNMMLEFDGLQWSIKSKASQIFHTESFETNSVTLLDSTEDSHRYLVKANSVHIRPGQSPLEIEYRFILNRSPFKPLDST